MSDESKWYNKKINILKANIQSMQKHPFIYRKAIKKKSVELQAIEEGARDVLTPTVTGRGITSSEAVNKNNYKTYERQIQGAYEMYNCHADYGAELCKGVVDFRSAAISGEGLSVNSKNVPKRKWIDEFLEYNKLHGSKLMDATTMGELEGKCLMLLKPGIHRLEKGKKVIKVSLFSYYLNRYKITLDPKDTEFIKEITYNEKSEASKQKNIPPDKAVYVKLGGMDFQINETSNRLHAILTDMENFSRSKYDLRQNTHLFGKVAPYWHTATPQEAKSINNDLQGDEAWQPGTGYAGSAGFSYVEPSGSAADQSLKDMLAALKCVSITTGIALHFLAYPELMSNRATAEAMHEILVVATKKERLIWEESYKDLIQKALIMAVDTGVADNAILKGDFQVKLPVVSISLLKQLIEIWKPLLDDNIISEFTFRNMLPGINPSEEIKLVDKEKEKRMEDSPLNNKTTNNLLNNQNNQNGDNNDPNIEPENNK